jgi:hypothetical protein
MVEYDTCISTSECTHSSWSEYDGGICWMKSGSVEKSDSTANYNIEMVCGIVPAKSNSKLNLEWSG